VLNQRWLAQEDELAADLAELDKAGVAVLFDPLPEASGKDFWWAGRKGVHGSLELYRQLFDRLVNHDGLHNLVWIWEAAAPDFRPGIEPTQPGDYFPGLLYVDAVEARLNRLDGRFPASRMLQPLAVGKPIGVEFSGELPAPEALTGNAGWSWFLADPAPDSPTRSEALRKLYADPGVVSLPAAQ
jgi:mannan endo-1,4-beta-mannosidase